LASSCTAKALKRRAASRCDAKALSDDAQPLAERVVGSEQLVGVLASEGQFLGIDREPG
jgi:hypothetical protein